MADSARSKLQKVRSGTQPYDVLIIGAGVSGTALLYTLANYTDLKRIAVLERHSDVAQVSSFTTQNSQTLHFGDIESNYTFEKAKSVNQSVEVLRHYIETIGKTDNTFVKRHKMLLAVGDEEIATLKQRFTTFKKIYPKIKFLDRDDIAKYEPKVVEGRDPHVAVAALWSPDGYIMDYYALSKSFVKRSLLKQIKDHKAIDLLFDIDVTHIERVDGLYVVTAADGRVFHTRVLVSDAGAMSIKFAKMLGYGKHLAIMSLAGDFYKAPQTLNGKVYTMQHPKRPNAAIHGDPDVREQGFTRFGPTAKVLFMLERRNYSTVADYFRTFNYSPAGFWSVIKTGLDPAYFTYLAENYCFTIPWLGKRILARHVRKIVPTIKASQIWRDKGYGATRPQIIDARAGKVNLGEARIEGDRAVFNITPSPGASTCLANAVKDTKWIMTTLPNHHFDEKKFSVDHKLAKAM